MPDLTEYKLQNYFYGTHDHYDHPGWYFDEVVDTLEDLNTNKIRAIRPGRFVLVKDLQAIFLRDGHDAEYYFVNPVMIDERHNKYYYVDKYNISGKVVDSVDISEYDPNAISITSGFRFIAYTNKLAQILLKNGSLAVQMEDSGPMLYTTITNLGYMASYYFGIPKEEED